MTLKPSLVSMLVPAMKTVSSNLDVAQENRYSVARKVEITTIDPMRGKASSLSCVIDSTQGFGPKPGNHRYKRTVVNS